MILGEASESVWVFPVDAVTASMAEMALHGADGVEGVAFWLGLVDELRVRVTHVLLPRGPGVVREPAYMSVSANVFNEISDVALEHGVRLIGHIHAHGLGWSTDLSAIDHAAGLHVGDYLSIVAPDYGLRERTALDDCGVHVFEHPAGYRRLPLGEVRRRVRTSMGAVEVLEVLG